MELNIKVDTKNGQAQIVNNTSKYAQNCDHFWNLAIRTTKLGNIDDMHVTGRIESNNKELLKVMSYAISQKLSCKYNGSSLEVLIKECTSLLF